MPARFPRIPPLRRALAALLIAAATIAAAGAQTGLPLPRFVSLRADEVNVRTGPGVRYPIDWVFQRKDLPVEITAEYDTWRKIRDAEGTEGWVHQSMLSGRRFVLITGEMRSLRREALDGAPTVAHVEAGVVGALKGCRANWCEIDVEGYDGWVKMGEFWGVYANETIDGD